MIHDVERRAHWRFAALALLAASACSSRPVVQGANLPALGALAAQIDQQQLYQLVSDLGDAHTSDTPLDCSGLNQGYPPFCHLTHDQSGTLMQQRLESLGLTVQRQATTGVTFPTSNIIADLPGTTRPNEIVLVGAHFDAYWKGADDNSTGAAAVMELARVLSQYKFDRTIRFVGFDLEEFGLIGSNRYVDELGGEKLAAAEVFDCIGYYDSRPGTQATLPGLPAPSAGDFLAVIGNDPSSQLASELYSLNDSLKLMSVTPLLSGGDGTSFVGGNLLRSDHTSFWLNGLNAVFLTDTASFRNPHYHKDSDTIDTLNFPSYTQAVRVAAVSLAYWAGGPR